MAIRLVFLGSPLFAVPSLERLAAEPDFDISLVVTQPDRPAGRGRSLSAPPVKQAARRLGLPLIQPNSMREPEALEALTAARPDVLVVVAYGELLRRAVLEAAPHGALNVHPSLLPRYRGAAPIPAAILNGDSVTGTSIIKLVRRLDAGPILAQRTLDISASDTTGTLTQRLAEQAAELLPATCRGWVAGRIVPVEQDEALATYTREWTRDDARVDWTAPAERIERLVRAAHPWPVAWTTLDGTVLRIEAARLPERPSVALPPGVATARDGRVLVGTGSGCLELERVQPAGKRVMPASDWWRGLRRDAVQFDM